MTTYWAAFICGWKHRNKHMVPATRFVRTTNIEQDQNPWLWGEGEDLNPQNSSGSDCESMRDHMCVLRESGKNSVEREGLDGDTPPIMLWCCYHGKVLRDNFLCTLPPVCVFFLSFVFFFFFTSSYCLLWHLLSLLSCGGPRPPHSDVSASAGCYLRSHRPQGGNYSWHVFNHHLFSQDNKQHLPTQPYVCNMETQGD